MGKISTSFNQEKLERRQDQQRYQDRMDKIAQTNIKMLQTQTDEYNKRVNQQKT